MEQLHIHAEHLELAVEPFELTDLVLDVLAVVLGNLDVATTDHDLHVTSRLDGCSRFDASPSTRRPDSRSDGPSRTISARFGQPRRSPREVAPDAPCRGVAATTAASTGGSSGRRSADSAAAASVSVAPLVTTSSTSTSSAPGAGRTDAVGSAKEPARLARRAAADRPAESRTRPAPAQQPGLARRQPGRPQLGHRPAGQLRARGPGRGCAAPPPSWAPAPAAPARAAGAALTTAATARASAVPSGPRELRPALLLERVDRGPHRAAVGAGRGRRREAPGEPPGRGRPRGREQRRAPRAEDPRRAPRSRRRCAAAPDRRARRPRTPPTEPAYGPVPGSRRACDGVRRDGVCWAAQSG